MASVYQLKAKFCDLLRPVAGFLVRRGVSANQVTVAAAGLSVFYGAALAFAPSSAALWLGLPVVLFVRMGLNAIDGVIAREWKQQSVLGAFLNELGDVVSDVALIAPIAAVHGAAGMAVAAFAGMAAATELAGSLGQRFDASRRYDGPMGKSDRAAALGAMALALGFFGPAAVGPVSFACWALAALCALTAANRVRSSITEIEAALCGAPAPAAQGAQAGVAQNENDEKENGEGGEAR
jgi:CDP-diacylglycerol---glycerol-3-phosphate 3-phosphatidyltransferase